MKLMAVAEYRAYLRMGIPDGEWELIRAAVQGGRLTGEDRFVAQVALALGRRIERRGPGRPGNKSVPIWTSIRERRLQIRQVFNITLAG